MDFANDNEAPEPYRENHFLLALALLASRDLWTMYGFWIWRALVGKAVGFNKRKTEDARRQVAEKEAVERRATDAQVLEDAERLIGAWNERQAQRMPMLFSPTIGAAVTAGYWFLWVRCPACRTINAIDLRTLDRHHAAAVTSLIPALSCQSASHRRRSPSSCGCRGPASPMRCASSTGGGCLASKRRLAARLVVGLLCFSAQRRPYDRRELIFTWL